MEGGAGCDAGRALARSSTNVISRALRLNFFYFNFFPQHSNLAESSVDMISRSLIYIVALDDLLRIA
jgi:hypothetical protein